MALWSEYTKMTNKQLNQLTAESIMKWTRKAEDSKWLGKWTFWHYYKNGREIMLTSSWKPCKDHNQVQSLINKDPKSFTHCLVWSVTHNVGESLDYLSKATPREKTIICLMAFQREVAFNGI